MSLLFRYVFFSHARLLLLTLGVGVGLYLLTELVERADTFVEANAGLSVIVAYFAARLPSIIAQILPAIFLLASVITLCVMTRSREMTALQAGGVSPNTVAAALVACGLFWGAVQLGCSQYLGALGDRYADRVWQEQVRRHEVQTRELHSVWFTDRQWIVSLDTLRQDGTGTGFHAYELSEDGLSFFTMVRAASFKAQPGEWTLHDVQRIQPGTFTSEHLSAWTLPLEQEVDVFFLAGRDNPQQMPLWLLGNAIRQLRQAGSNVEGLRTAWHGKLAYAASLMVMAVLAAAIVSWKDNVYLAVSLSLLVTFVTYTLILFGESMGQRGLLPPMLAAWGPDMLLLVVAGLRLHYVAVRR